MENTLTEQVFDFVAAELPVKYKNLTLETRIYHDLGCIGDDGEEFIEAFANQFDVDISNFNVGLHFGSEPGVFDFRKKVPITIGDLVKAAGSKRWQPPNRPKQ